MRISSRQSNPNEAHLVAWQRKVVWRHHHPLQKVWNLLHLHRAHTHTMHSVNIIDSVV